VLKGKCGIKYISRILESYQKQNITTVQQAKQNEEEYKTQQQNKNSYKNATEKIKELERKVSEEEND